MMPLRRVVTGLDVDGRSCICIDDLASPVVWRTDDTPAVNDGIEDKGGTVVKFSNKGTQCVFLDFRPGQVMELHATDTIDYVVILSGEITLVTETEETTLRTGDALIDRGVAHGWENRGSAECRMVTVLAPALPVGKGASLTGEMHF